MEVLVMILNSSLADKLSQFYKNSQYKQANVKFWDTEVLYGTVAVSSDFHIWVYKTSKDGLDFVYLHKRSPLSNQAIALPVYWVSSNDFEFSSFLLLKDSGVVEWEDDYFDKRLFLAKYILKPTYTIEVHRTLWKKYKYIFLYKYNNTTRQGLAIPVEAVPKISRLIHAIIDGKKIVFKVGDKIRSYDVKNGAIDIGTVMHIYDSEQELVAKFEDGAWVRLQFCDCEIV